jgi:hypothetical protein
MKPPSIKSLTYYPLYIFLLLSFYVLSSDYHSFDDQRPNDINDQKLSSGTLDLPVPVFVPTLGSPIEMGSVNLEDIIVGDFNCNGLDDIAAPARNGDVVIAYRSVFRTGFLPSAVSSGTPSLRGGAVGDFNDDGCDDLAAVNSSSPGYTVALLGHSDGLAPARGSPMETPYSPWGVDVGDFNADGLDDIVSADASNDLAYVFLANPGGKFSSASTFSLGRNSIHVEIGDFDNNGTADIFSTNHNAMTATILLNNGEGGFIQALGSPLSVVQNPCRPLAADFNSDDNMDIMLRSANRPLVFYPGDGASNFGQATIIDATLPMAGCGQFAAADLDGNGRLDLAVPANDRIRFLYQRDDGTYMKVTSEPFPGLVFTGLTVFDFESDGKVEIVAGAQRSGEALILVLGRDILFVSGFE